MAPQENPNALIFGKAASGTGGVWPQLGSAFGGEPVLKVEQGCHEELGRAEPITLKNAV